MRKTALTKHGSVSAESPCAKQPLPRTGRTPAVFVEFGDITWRQVKCGSDVLAWRGTGTVNVHIVTEWAAADDGCFCDLRREGSLDLADIVHGRLEGLCGEGYDSLSLSRTMTNHDHEDIVEDIDVYTVRYARELPCGGD